MDRGREGRRAGRFTCGFEKLRQSRVRWHVWMCVVCVCTSTRRHAYLWTPDVAPRCFPLLCTSFVVQGFSLNLSLPVQTDWPASSRALPISTSQMLGYRLAPTPGFLGEGEGDPSSGGPCAYRTSPLTTEPSPQPRSGIFRIPCLSPYSPPPPPAAGSPQSLSVP